MRLHPTRLVVKGIKRIGCTASRARTNQLQALLQVTIGVLEDWEWGSHLARGSLTQSSLVHEYMT